MRISPADGGASKDTLAADCWLRGLLLGAMRTASLHCGRDVIGNTPFVTRQILFGTWITVHYNPVKHRLVTRVRDWPHSSFHFYVRRGLLPEDWAGDVNEGPSGYGERRE